MSPGRKRGAKIVERRLLLLDGSPRTLHRRLERPVVDAEDELAGVDMLVVLDQDLIDMPGNTWRQRRDIAADIGIVGRHQEPAGLPPLKAIPAGDADGDRGAQHDERLAAAFGGRGDLDGGWLRRLQFGGGENLVHLPRASSRL